MDQNFTFDPNEYELVENFSDSQCFGCGNRNAHGLHMQYYKKENTLTSKVMLPDYLCGWSSEVAHGGILCFLLDEIMGMAILTLQKCFVVTKTIECNLIKPVLIKCPIVVKAEIIKNYKNKVFTVEGGLYNPENELSASAVAKYLVILPKHLQDYWKVPKKSVDRILELFLKDTHG